jgi:hypothetical protein
MPFASVGEFIVRTRYKRHSFVSSQRVYMLR